MRLSDGRSGDLELNIGVKSYLSLLFCMVTCLSFAGVPSDNFDVACLSPQDLAMVERALERLAGLVAEQRQKSNFPARILPRLRKSVSSPQRQISKPFK